MLFTDVLSEDNPYNLNLQKPSEIMSSNEIGSESEVVEDLSPQK